MRQKNSHTKASAKKHDFGLKYTKNVYFPRKRRFTGFVFIITVRGAQVPVIIGVLGISVPQNMERDALLRENFR